MRRHLKDRYRRLFVNYFEYSHKIIIFMSFEIIIFMFLRSFKVIVFMFLGVIGVIIIMNIVVIYRSHVRYQPLLSSINILKRLLRVL